MALGRRDAPRPDRGHRRLGLRPADPRRRGHERGAGRARRSSPGQSLSGLLLGARGEIWVNAEEARTWPTRRRFTIGHELGHWELHRDLQRTLFCRATTVKEDQPRAVPDIEEEASRFAAALLMPQWLMVRAYGELGDDLDAMCKRFRTSGVAMNRRMATLFGASE